MSVRIAPSVLTADWGHLAAIVAVCQSGGADWIHLDVMDGQFVPNLTFGTKVIETIRGLTSVPLDVHMMVVQPEKYFEEFAEAGANRMTIHVEAAPHLHRQIMRIRQLGCAAGAAVNPGTPVESVGDVAADLDTLLVMSVDPGFGGQEFIAHSVDKIRRARLLLDRTASQAALEVDGGIGRDTIAACWRAGADTFVAGNAIFGASDPGAEIGALRECCRVIT